MKTIAQQLNIKDFPFIINDKNGNRTYREFSNGTWSKYEYNENGNRTYYENFRGFWCKHEYDKNGTVIYYENSDGVIEDNRSTELTFQEIADKIGINVKNLKIKDQ